MVGYGRFSARQKVVYLICKRYFCFKFVKQTTEPKGIFNLIFYAVESWKT